jgi:hypothetical protein
VGLLALVVVGDDGDRVGNSLKVRVMGVNATRRLAVWAVRRSWKGIVVSYSFPGCLIVVGSMDGRRG